jgi:CubicO group peptidase (beta-lactamase class C family)
MRKDTISGGALIVAMVAALAVACFPPSPEPEQAATTYWPTKEWRTSTPEAEGLDSAKLAEGLQAMEDRDIAIDSLLVARDGKVVLDAYFEPYDGTFPHELASVTKSVMTTLIGIAVDQGKLQLDQPALSFFPDRAIANMDARKEKMTIRDLVSNRNGFQSGCLARDEPTLDAMRAEPDWVQAALDRKMVRDPGTAFCYDSPGMHLLSAILQEATGMTALEFAQENLFGPLGITDVIWDDDPQGYTRGWGDLHLKPRDAAKLGYLWLNDGMWDGKQVVSPAWVQDAVTRHSKTGAGKDDYGYGWWISEQEYIASGRGGQSVRVVPSLNAIVVTTGSGFEYDLIAPYLVAALTKGGEPLPANPAGVAQLEETVAAIGQPAQPEPTGPLPETARAISGKVYRFEPNPVGLESMSIDFDDATQAMLHVKLQEYAETRDWPAGLDGKFRVSAEGRALRGHWIDDETFAFEIFDNGQEFHQVRFADDRIEFSSPTFGIKFEGRQQNP